MKRLVALVPVDPLFTFDLGDPTNVRKVGELVDDLVFLVRKEPSHHQRAPGPARRRWLDSNRSRDGALHFVAKRRVGQCWDAAQPKRVYMGWRVGAPRWRVVLPPDLYRS